MVIALFTDFGTRDAYVAQLKGVILSIHPTASLLDLTHDVPVFDVRAASYLLEASGRYFPAGTIFVAVVDPGVGTARHPLLLVTHADKYYLGPDNGLFTRVIACEGMRAAYVLTHTRYMRAPVSATFHGRDIFGPVAAHLARGIAPEHVGTRIHEVIRLPATEPTRVGETLLGEVIYLDHYGNIATNIPAAMLTALQPGSWLQLTLLGRTHVLSLVTTYGAGPPDQLLGLINSNGDFEVALAGGSAAARLAVRLGERVRLRCGMDNADPQP